MNDITKEYLKTVREEFDELIAKALIDHPEITQAEIGAQFGVSRYWVIDVGKKFAIVRPVGRKASKKAVSQ